MRHWSRTTLLVGATGLIAAIAGGLVFGGMPWWLLAFSALVNLRLIVDIQRLFDWVQKPLNRPRQFDQAWQRALFALHLRLRRERQRGRELLDQLRGLRAITRSLPDAAISTNELGEILSFNPAAASLLRLQQSDVGTSLPSLIRHPEFVALLKGQANEDSVEMMSPFQDGQRLEARWLPVSQTQSLVVVRNVTQLNKLLTMRQDFIANVSHELRTPLTVVKGYLEALGDGDLSPEMMKTIVDRLHSPTRRMQALVDDLLLLTRLESSPDISEREREPIDMRRVIEGVRREAQVLQIEDQLLKVSIESTRELYGVESEIHSAVTNLVTNALRYSPDGGVIAISWRDLALNEAGTDSESDSESRAGAGAELCVEDQGVGIAPEHISRITERFYRVDMASARVRGGTGLGLAIVKHVLKRHGATLEVESEIGVGSVFRCHFPAQMLADAPVPSLQASH